MKCRRGLKRAVDVGLVLIFLPFWASLTILIGLFVKFEDGGPMIYRRRVVGMNGEFDAFKLRTMRVDADEWLAQHPELAAEFQKNFKLRQDPRITTVGRILRKYSLDELPQLVNVLRGQMSLVGPRMITAPELEKYGDYRQVILAVKPGLTGLWQTSGRQNVGYDERVRMDVAYVRNWCIWLDVKILGKTAWKVIRREGAY